MHDREAEPLVAWLETIQHSLFRYCLYLAGTRWEADDLLQDTIVRVLQALENRSSCQVSRPEGIHFRYVCRIARNLWIDRCRRQKKVSIELNSEAIASGGCEEESLHIRENLEVLAGRLAPKPFVIVLLMDVFQFTAKETAAWLGGTEVATQVALSRARSRLRTLSLAESGRIPSDGSANASVTKTMVPHALFEAVLDAFRRRSPAAIQKAYVMLYGSGSGLLSLRYTAGRLFFTFEDPDGNMLMVST